MHSGEVAPSQSLPIFAHDMATTDDPEVLGRLDDVVLMFVPSHNPDGMDMVVEHYREYLGTTYEGSRLPRVYHKYVGHDNNRDFVSLTQEDTRVIAALYSTEWYPQVMVEKHQMGSTGPRYYVPPNHDPIAQNVDEGLWTWSAVFGSNLSHDMAKDGLQGVASHWVFDDYWPGSTETSIYKNVISFLTEAASCRTASPVFVEPTELSVRGKGLAGALERRSARRLRGLLLGRDRIGGGGARDPRAARPTPPRACSCSGDSLRIGSRGALHLRGGSRHRDAGLRAERARRAFTRRRVLRSPRRRRGRRAGAAR